MSRKIDLTGQKFGKLTVIEYAGSDKNGHAKWHCKCDCGVEKTVLGTSLVRGFTTSCGCYHKEKAKANNHKIDISGKRFGRLIAIKPVQNSKNGDAKWKCKCDCGNETNVKYQHLKSGEIKSCGCWKEAPKKHGMTTKGERPRIYGIWVGMKQRCTNPNVEKYPRYGGRGIKVCPEWEEDFQAFYEWAIANGYQDNLTIDRIDNDGNYEPSNCQWITSEENTRKRFE